MESIINKILEIDENARKKLENAYTTKSQILYEAEQEEDNIKKDVLNRVSGRVAKVEEFEKTTADEKIEKIKNQSYQTIEYINKKFEENHQQWEEDIFKKVIEKSHKS